MAWKARKSMRNLLGVSLFAMFIVAPVLVRAEPIEQLQLQNGGNVPTAPQVLATTAYVKGAYNTVANKINDVITNITVPTATYDHIDATKSVAENLVSLNNAIDSAANTSGSTYATMSSAAPALATGAEAFHYVSVESDEVPTTIGENLGKLDAAVYANESAISTLNGDSNTAGSVAFAVKGEADRATLAETALSDRIGTLGSDKNYIRTANDVYTNMTALDTQVHDNELHIGSMNGLRSSGALSTIESRSTLVSAINTLDTAISNAGIATNLVDGHYVGTNNGKNSVADNLTALDTQVYNNTQKIGTADMETAAPTITGAIQEMHRQTLEVATVWNSSDTQPLNLFTQPEDEGDGD